MFWSSPGRGWGGNKMRLSKNTHSHIQPEGGQASGDNIRPPIYDCRHLQRWDYPKYDELSVQQVENCSQAELSQPVITASK